MVRSATRARAVNDWLPPALAVVIGAAVIDLSLFGWSLRALGLGRPFDGPAPGERVVFDRKVSVQSGRLGLGWAWAGRLVVTDRRLVSCWGYWSRVAVLDISRAEVVDVRRGWWWWYPCVRLSYEQRQRRRSLRIVTTRLRLLQARDELLGAFRSAGYPVVA
jgi:hypothetical protein